MVYTIVPVELRSFTAEIKDNTIILNWQTITELNNSGFDIEKLSSDGWKKIGFVKGNGSTTGQQSYSFLDENVIAGKQSYRLKQIDYDGTYRIYGPVEVDYTGVLTYELEQNYPNPFNPVTTIHYQLPADGMVTIKVYDIIGREVKTLVNDFKTKGRYEINFDASGLSSGIYIYQIISGSYKALRKMLLTK